ncbi:Fic family protein [Dysgonomonas reticulitermitis]
MKNQLRKLIEEYCSLQPFSEDCKKRLDKKFRLEFNYNSNHLEGNTLTYGQTKLLLIFGDTTGDARMRDYEEMKAHNVGLRWIEETAKDKSRQLTERDIRDLNKIILVEDYWKTNPKNGSRYEIKIGVYKTRPNSVITATGEEFHYASPEETPAMMNDFVSWMNKEIAEGSMPPVELASLVHYRYIRIHPFEDGNGRIARLLVNYVLMRYGYPMVIIKSEDKENYLRVLHQSDINVGLTPSDGANAKFEDIEPFINYMIKQLAWSLDLSIRGAKGESIEEQDDWEKQLSLLKKGSGDRNKNEEAVKKLEESLEYIYKNVIEVFCKNYDSKISKFNDLFTGCICEIAIENKKYRNSSSMECLKAIYKEKNKLAIDNIIIKSIFINLRELYTEVELSSEQVFFSFLKETYAIDYKKNRQEYSYNELPTEEELNTIISHIGKDLLEKIEKAINS